jgi:DNA-binding transcriptional regulator YiaG
MKQKNPKCHECGKEFIHRIAPPRRVRMRYEGSPQDVLVEHLPEWHCAGCNVSITDGESDEAFQNALRKHIGLLSPQQIKAGLKELDISQDRFAERLGCAAESVSRWLNGAVLQSRAYDRLMRIYFHFPEVRGVLANFTPDSSFGDTVVHALADALHGSESSRNFRDLASAELQTEVITAWKTAFASHVATTLLSQFRPAVVGASSSPTIRFTAFGAIDRGWTARTEFYGDRGGRGSKGPASRIPESAWFGVGGEAA